MNICRAYDRLFESHLILKDDYRKVLRAYQNLTIIHDELRGITMNTIIEVERQSKIAEEAFLDSLFMDEEEYEDVVEQHKRESMFLVIEGEE